MKKIGIAIFLASFLSGCSGYIYNNNPTGPIFVKRVLSEPTPEPVIEPEPEPVVLSVDQQNQQAVLVFDEKGFDTEITDKGVVVYLPPTIFFAGSSSSIDLDARTKIAEIAAEINQPYLSKRIVEISGHTDSFGEEEFNFELSKKRAIAAAAELIFSNVNKTRLNTLWYGETAPRAPEINPDGSINTDNRNLNRRVEFVILNPY